MIKEINTLKNKIIKKMCYGLDPSMLNLKTHTFIDPSFMIKDNKFVFDGKNIRDDSKESKVVLNMMLSYNILSTESIVKATIYMKKDIIEIRWFYKVHIDPDELEKISRIRYQTETFKNPDADYFYRQIYRLFVYEFFGFFKRIDRIDNSIYSSKEVYNTCKKTLEHKLEAELIKNIDEI